jgi:glucoamylase
MKPTDNSVAFGAPGIEPRWTSSAKEGVGTAYHTSCRLWFTLSHGIVNEIYYPRVDQPNTRDFRVGIFCECSLPAGSGSNPLSEDSLH